MVERSGAGPCQAVLEVLLIELNHSMVVRTGFYFACFCVALMRPKVVWTGRPWLCWVMNPVSWQDPGHRVQPEMECTGCVAGNPGKQQPKHSVLVPCHEA